MKSAWSTRYVDLMGDLPNRRWDTVTPPDFLESYSKYPWTYRSVLSPMILMVFLLAPTVPSEPKPKNLARINPSGAASKVSVTSKEVLVTSSVMPTVNRVLGLSKVKLSNTALAMDGVNSLEPKP